MNMRRLYETTIIINAALEDTDVETVITRMQEYVENNGGKIVEMNRWGRRRLAYPINKKFNGFYLHCIFEAPAATIPLLERFFVLEENIIRHLTLLLPQEMREHRAQRELHYAKLEEQENASAEDSIAEDDADKAPETEETVENNG
jgi:small subunit ribosomal protein S6